LKSFGLNMAVLDILQQLDWDKFGITQGDIDITGGLNSMTLPTSGKSHFHVKSLRVRSGATLTVPQGAVGGPPIPTLGCYSAIVFVEGDVLIEGTMYPTYATVTVLGSTNWDGATNGGNGSATTAGTAGGATSGTAHSLHDILFNGHYNATDTDYRYAQFFWHWFNAGHGGKGWSTVTGSASVNNGFGGGALLIIARGTISIASGGVLQADGANGANGVVALTGAEAGGGGGGAGIIGLISFRKITAVAGGRFSANGGRGGNGAAAGRGLGSGLFAQGGGGGGGGYIFAIAPSLTLGLNTIQAFHGSAGTTANNPGGLLFAYGGGGGGSFNVGSVGGKGSFVDPGGVTLIFNGFSRWMGV